MIRVIAELMAVTTDRVRHGTASANLTPNTAHATNDANKRIMPSGAIINMNIIVFTAAAIGIAERQLASRSGGVNAKAVASSASTIIVNAYRRKLFDAIVK